MTTTFSLMEFYRSRRQRSEPLVLATIIRTAGSTYRKAGAQMLIAGDSQAAGLLSGGCLESDLMERARSVFETGQPVFVDYDMRNDDDLLWGIGLGCEGAMRILLTRLDEHNGYQPYAFIAECMERHRPGVYALTTHAEGEAMAPGNSWQTAVAGDAPPVLRPLLSDPVAAARKLPAVVRDGATEYFVDDVELPRRLLVMGAGPDARPVVEVASMLGWQVTVIDHRPAYADATRFPRARDVRLSPAAAVNNAVTLADFDAAVVMSHHLPSDQQYLAAVADSAIGYVGLLGPAARRARLLSEIGNKAVLLDGRLYGPVGLDIGAATPEAIAIAIVGEIQAVLNGRSGASFSRHL